MATSQDFIEYVCDQLKELGIVRFRKMFGEYMIYIDDKPIILVCDSIVYVKKLEEVKELIKEEVIGIPYAGAKEHYILDIDDITTCRVVIQKLLEIIPVPKPKKKKE